MNKPSTPIAAAGVATGHFPLKAYLVLAALSLIWGTSFILIKKGLVIYSGMQVGLLRLGISALAFAPVLAYNYTRINWKRWPVLLGVGLTGTFFPAILFALAQTQVSSSVAGILNSLAPLFTLLIGILFFRARLVWLKVLGVTVGLGGAILLIVMNKGLDFQANIGYSLLAVIATACYGATNNLVSTYLRDMNSVLIGAASFFMVGLPALLYLLGATDFTTILATEPGAWAALGYIAILALFSTVTASILFFRLIQWTEPIFASTVAYLVPMVALGWGLVDGEAIGLFHLLGLGLILSGVYLTRKR